MNISLFNNEIVRVINRFCLGIPAEKTSSLFDSFSQVDSSTTRKFGGTGLGLAIVKKLCNLMGGDISVTSELGRGSTFNFHINLDKSKSSQQVMPKVDMKDLKILIVDDNKTNREVIRGQLKRWGAKVFEAESGQHALLICAQKYQNKESPPFDVAFLDMQMPNIDGAELGKTIKSDSRFSKIKLIMMTSMGHLGEVNITIPIIAMTANAMADDRKKCLDAGMNDYLSKPIEANLLIMKLLHWLKNKTV